MSSPTSADPDDLPEHHVPGGGFRKPWLPPKTNRHGLFPVLRWKLGTLLEPTAPDPRPGDLPSAAPAIAAPAASERELRTTFLGHAAFLLQIGGRNVLTDPVFSERASPVQWMGPRRFSPPVLAVDDLPPIDAVVLSHDHYDHMDEGTIRALHARFGERITWVTPLAYRPWFAERGIRNVVELDWWERTREVEGLEITAAPTQHWTRRGWTPNERLWASWRIEVAGGPSVYFGGDSGYWHGFSEIRERFGPHDLVLLPIGAYEPRWFMHLSHMNPEDAVQAYLDLGGAGVCAGMHWGVFRLTDEPPLEPPERMRTAWREAGLPEAGLWTPALGETLVLGDEGMG